MNFRILVVLFSVLFVSYANAVPVKQLYRAEIKLPVEESEAKMLNQAFSQAVEQVLVRVSGDKAAISGSLLQEARSRASTWVAQHSVVSLNQLLPVDGQLVAGNQVNVVFYSESIDQFLSQHNLPVWGRDRPSVLIWAASEENGVRRLSGGSAPSQLLNDLASSAAMLGVPIYAPLIDTVDKKAISAADVWGFFEGNIRQASRRYQTDAIAAMRVTNYSGNVTGSLLVLLSDGSSQRFTLSGENVSALADQASADMAKVFSTRYAAVRNNQAESRFLIQVSGISSYAALNRVQTYLERVGVVRDAAIASAKGDTVTFSIAINGSKQKLINSISLNSVLQQVAPPKPALVVTNTEATDSTEVPVGEASAPAVAVVSDDNGDDTRSPEVAVVPNDSGDDSRPLVVEYFKYNGVQ
ncbi:DUF2066 domain-containing protein [Marinomonas pollencensis]|uniref:DUF2066 domain-containing protein n=1 Tax=Marinomonas pollencensis TaxID=491954 RepID=A0A3E0DMQ5_9GAMM|nr:DUF2066 domain-containing protein [Marinomonas pollencensis]REG84156.1 hypothetical protein DFP81_10435 [Marinomonas pollencensis]